MALPTENTETNPSISFSPFPFVLTNIHSLSKYIFPNTDTICAFLFPEYAVVKFPSILSSNITKMALALFTNYARSKLEVELEYFSKVSNFLVCIQLSFNV